MSVSQIPQNFLESSAGVEAQHIAYRFSAAALTGGAIAGMIMCPPVGFAAALVAGVLIYLDSRTLDCADPFQLSIIKENCQKNGFQYALRRYGIRNIIQYKLLDDQNTKKAQFEMLKRPFNDRHIHMFDQEGFITDYKLLLGYGMYLAGLTSKDLDGIQKDTTLNEKQEQSLVKAAKEIEDENLQRYLDAFSQGLSSLQASPYATPLA